MAKTITIQPVTRIEGHAAIGIQLDDAATCRCQGQLPVLRGFEKFVEGKPAEELPRIVNRICGICPWMHHLASNKAVDGCFGVPRPRPGSKLRELMQTMSHIEDKLLHFFFLAAADFVIGPDSDYSVRNVIGIVKANPELAQQGGSDAADGQDDAGQASPAKTIHPVAGRSRRIRQAAAGRRAQGHPGQDAPAPRFRPVHHRLRQEGGLSQIPRYHQDAGRDQHRFHRYRGWRRGPEPVRRQAAVDEGGRQPTSSSHPPTTCRLHRRKGRALFLRQVSLRQVLGRGFSLDLDAPKGIYRANTLARINVADKMATPRAQAELEEFRELFGRPAQATLLYHYARLIEEIYACERAIELLEDPVITEPRRRAPVEPKAGRGVGCVEAPRGTLIHDYTTDENGLIVKANMIVGTTHNLGPINMSVTRRPGP
jgi:F420-non-reducing hydrogenase large subunit